MLSESFAVLAVMERFDESLALLSHTLCWPLEELAYLKVNEHRSSYARPEPEAVRELEKILSVDLMLVSESQSESESENADHMHTTRRLARSTRGPPTTRHPPPATRHPPPVQICDGRAGP